MMADLNRMNESKEKINQSTSFLLFFLQSLPPLPLSSFLPSSSIIINNNYNIKMQEENKEEKGIRRIRDFFEKKNLISLYSSLLPSSLSSSLLSQSIIIHNKNGRKIYGEEEKGKRNKMAIHSPLNYCVICDVYNNRILFNITTRDLICSYQPTLPPPLPPSSYPYYFQSLCGISIDEEADLISVSDVAPHSISLFLSPIF